MSRHYPSVLLRKALSMASSSELAVFLLFLSIFLFTAGGRFYSADELIMFQLTQNVVQRNTLAVRPFVDMPAFQVAQGRDDLFYASKAPGVSVVAIPLYLLGRSLGETVTLQGEPCHACPFIGAEAVASLLNVLVTAATAALLFALALWLGYRHVTCWLIVALWGLGTMAWVYASKTMETEPLETLGILAASLAAARFSGQARWAALMGASIGLAFSARAVHLPLALPFGVFLLFRLRKENHGPEAWLKAIMAFALGVGAFVAPVGLYNWYRFGNPLETGYALAWGGGSLPIGLPDLSAGWQLLFSSGKGLLWYAPPAFLSLWGVRGFVSKRPDYGWLLISVIAMIFILTISWVEPYGGWSWGPKFLQPAVPLLILLGGLGLPSEPESARLPWLAVGILLGISILISFLGVAANYSLWYLYVEEVNFPFGVVHNLVFFDSRWSPILGHAILFFREGPDFFWNRALTIVKPFDLAATFLAGFWRLWSVSALATAGVVGIRIWLRRTPSSTWPRS